MKVIGTIDGYWYDLQLIMFLPSLDLYCMGIPCTWGIFAAISSQYR